MNIDSQSRFVLLSRAFGQELFRCIFVFTFALFALCLCFVSVVLNVSFHFSESIVPNSFKNIMSVAQKSEIFLRGFASPWQKELYDVAPTCKWSCIVFLFQGQHRCIGPAISPRPLF